MNKPAFIIIHCSASEFGDAALLDQWHRSRGFSRIGYHYVIPNGRLSKKQMDSSLNGALQGGRPENEIGAHCRGFNERSLGICLIGMKSFSFEQYRTLSNLIREKRKVYGIPLANVLGHCETESGKAEGKTCPNFDVVAYRKHLAPPVQA